MNLSVGGRELSFSRSELVLLIVGVSLLGYGGYEYVHQQHAIESAVAVDATMTDVGVEQTDGRGIDYVPVVSYEYRFEGAAYTGGAVFPGSVHLAHDTRSEARAVVEPYSVNQTVTAYVDPQSPADAFLERTTTSGPLVLGGVGAAVLVVGLVRGRQNAIDTGDGDADENPESGGTGHEPTVLGIDHGRLGAICKRCVVGSLVATWLSVMGAAVVLFGTSSPSSSSSSSIQPDLFGPIGIALLVVLLSACALVVSLLGYGGWSYLEARQVRKAGRLERHRSLLGVLLADEADLNRYEQRIRLTAVSLLLAVVLLTVLLDMLGVVAVPW